MIPKLILEQVIDSQKERLNQLDTGLQRKVPDYTLFKAHALIISGIRRCGKSTLLQQINKTFTENTLFVNFEDPRLAGFDPNDFNRLKEIILSRGINILFFDEIQIVEKWENYIRFSLDEGYRVFITGSNASMLSRELGTKLTGRHIPKELFPFSFNEYIAFTGSKSNVSSVEQFMQHGGFPEMIKTNMPEILMNTFNDIVTRDIAIRYNIRNISALQKLSVWLISNVGKPITGNSLKKLFSIGSSSSIMEYLSFFSDAYLFYFVPRFSYSYKAQIINPRKLYAADNGLIEVNSLTFTPDNGRLFENMVFMHLRRSSKEIYYFAEKKECDFVISYKGKVSAIYQACWQLNQDNLDRELSGLKEAMDFFGLNRSAIITLNQSDSFVIDGRTIQVIPFSDWVTTENSQVVKD
ncbi:MAG: ATP-binding protein [Bacteroidales bacterium]|nr:ATP-binding protein [Bacteroidales bacterium]